MTHVGGHGGRAGIALKAPDTGTRIVTLVAVTLIFGVVNAVVKPVVKVPRLRLLRAHVGPDRVRREHAAVPTGRAARGALGLGFTVDGFGPAFVGAIVVGLAIPDRLDQR
jgi:putative membrane protein